MPTVTRDRRDAELLAAFAATQDNAAFAELVRRHGPLVYGVCRRVLADSCEADDAYQAVLIVLARKAGTVRDPGRLAPWLYGVAVRCARRARGAKLMRRSRESPMPDLPARAVDADWADVRPVLDAEVDRLPDKLRAALVLCELQGVGRAEAAVRLGVPEGTVSSRLARAKDALRVRLTRRGVTLSAVGLAAMLGRAQAATAGLPTAGTPSAAALAIAHAETAMLLSHGLVKVVLTLLTAAGLTIAGVALIPADLPEKPPAAGPDPVAAEKAKLVGEWRLVSAKFQGHEAIGQPAGENHSAVWTFTADVVRFNGATNRYAIDPSLVTKRIDLVPPDGPADANMIPGVYKIDGDSLTVHYHNARVPNRQAATRRPAGFAATEDRDTWLYVLERVKPTARPWAAPAGALSGQVRVNGQPATSGRVTVYIGKAEFVGSLVVGGAYGISYVPPGTHRLVVEAEAAGVTEATTLTKEFKAGERSTRDFDLKPR